MNINWKLKSFIFSLLVLTRSYRLLYFIQKYITKRSEITNLKVSRNWKFHEENFKSHAPNPTIFEFGAGKDLSQNLYLSKIFNKQVLVDIFPMLDLDLVEKARILLKKAKILNSQKKINEISDLKFYDIDYIAPCDASDTGFDDDFFDGCISTNTLEHIPKNDIVKIFNELKRIIRKSGFISIIIDYSDHYAHTDKNISLLNFLTFNEKKWRKYNHKCHFQNRLRHNEYREIFLDLNFKIIMEKEIQEEKSIPKSLLSKYDSSDSSWKSTKGYFLLSNN